MNELNHPTYSWLCCSYYPLRLSMAVVVAHDSKMTERMDVFRVLATGVVVKD